MYAPLYHHFNFTDQNFVGISDLFILYHMPRSPHPPQLAHNVNVK
jgi:hypothetical protein